MGTDILGCDFVPHGTVKHKKTKKRKLESDVVLTCSLPNSNSCLSESSFPRSSSLPSQRTVPLPTGRWRSNRDALRVWGSSGGHLRKSKCSEKVKVR